jgi:hypothetical protein
LTILDIRVNVLTKFVSRRTKGQGILGRMGTALGMQEEESVGPSALHRGEACCYSEMVNPLATQAASSGMVYDDL